MKITIESTRKIVMLETLSGHVAARVWQGETENGIPVQCFIPRIAPEVEEGDPRFADVQKQFQEELDRMADPRPSVAAIPLRMVI